MRVIITGGTIDKSYESVPGGLLNHTRQTAE